MHPRIFARSLGLIGLASTLALSTAWAQQPQTVRIRGTIEQVEGTTYVVKTRDGVDYKVMVPDKSEIVAVVKSSLASVKQGSFVGATGMPQPDGSQKALEVHIFPESMRGSGEGHREWDLQPKSTMTNASVEQIVSSVDGQTIMVKYKGGEKKIIVSPDTPVVAFVL